MIRKRKNNSETKRSAALQNAKASVSAAEDSKRKRRESRSRSDTRAEKPKKLPNTILEHVYCVESLL